MDFSKEIPGFSGKIYIPEIAIRQEIPQLYWEFSGQVHVHCLKHL